MAYDLEEQEQIDALKAWWQQYGNLVVLAALACLITIAGFQGWRYYRAQQMERAATLFGQLDEADARELTVKHLRAEAPQRRLKLAEALALVQAPV